ncbi:MAG: IS110 family transposase [Sediminibacterium sp.]|uniref:IS110 family transposase n=1 Tax=Sediminibacterium sp. TaxID=1917865 RepID=UPI00271B15B0|nr:IS110 family transposase [Sediminibacterium sp.]MDO8996085.1 IS110 family transposase [Sediminibacterium sp.]
MQTQKTGLDFKGQNIFVGIDVHLKSWTVTILTEELMHKTFTQPCSTEILFNYLNRNFPGGSYNSVYEAGFSGFWTHYKLKEMGINNIVINPADVPTSQKEQLQKDDPTDSRKLARSLRSGDLKGIYIPSIETLGDRSLVRMRSTLVKDMVRFKQRVKSFLYFYGIAYPPEFEKSGTHWSNRFMKWLNEVSLQHESGTQALKILLQEVGHQRMLLLEVLRKIRLLSRSERYAENVALLRTIPGIALITAITFLTEIETIERFKSTDHLAGFVGLVPNYHSSGEKTNNGEMTFRGNNLLRSSLIENSWIAVRHDPAMTMSYHNYIKRMEANKAIVRIARKMLNRIYFVLKNKKEYVLCVVN